MLVPAQGVGAEHRYGMAATSPPCATALRSPAGERGPSSCPFAVRYHQICKIRVFSELLEGVDRDLSKQAGEKPRSL